MGLFDVFRASKQLSKHEKAEVEKFLKGDTKKPTEDNLAALDELLEMYLRLIDAQEYLQKNTNGFNEMDLTPLRMELRRSVNKANEGGTKQFQIIADDILQAKKECSNLVAKLISLYNEQHDKPFHASMLDEAKR